MAVHFVRRLVPAQIRLLVALYFAGSGHVVAAGPDGSQIPISDDARPHFEAVDGRQVFFVDGHPHVVLAVEIPWWDIVCGQEGETMRAYDRLYPVARSLGLNALKVPVKWSQVEPQPGRFDFSYVDHAKRLAEQHGLKLVLCWFGHHGSSDGTIYYNLSGDVFAPLDIIRDDKTYPRAVDADGVPHHNAASYENDAIVRRESAAFSAFMRHIRQVDAETRTILMIQVENEIAVFGWDRQNRKFWRDHCSAANELFARMKFQSDLRYSAWRLSTNWIKPITDAGAVAYAIPFYLNFVSSKLPDGIVGGAPGEDVSTYLENCPAITFIGVNPYLSADSSVSDLRAVLDRYQVGRNIVAISETNSDRSSVAPRLAYLAIGEYGAPLFAPWSLTVSAPTFFQPYVRDDGSLANGASALRDCYVSLSMALPEIAYYAASEKLKVFMSPAPDREFSDSKNVGGASVKVSGWQNGQAIVIHPTPDEFIVVGYRCQISIPGDQFVWPDIQNILVERGRSTPSGWKRAGEPYFGIDQSNRTLNLYLETPQAIRVTHGHVGAER